MAQTEELTLEAGGNGDKIYHDLPVDFDDGDGGGVVPESQEVTDARVQRTFHLEHREGDGGREESVLPGQLGKSAVRLGLERDRIIQEARERVSQGIGLMALEDTEDFRRYGYYY